MRGRLQCGGRAAVWWEGCSVVGGLQCGATETGAVEGRT